MKMQSSDAGALRNEKKRTLQRVHTRKLFVSGLYFSLTHSPSHIYTIYIYIYLCTAAGKFTPTRYNSFFNHSTIAFWRSDEYRDVYCVRRPGAQDKEASGPDKQNDHVEGIVLKAELVPL